MVRVVCCDRDAPGGAKLDDDDLGAECECGAGEVRGVAGLGDVRGVRRRTGGSFVTSGVSRAFVTSAASARSTSAFDESDCVAGA